MSTRGIVCFKANMNGPFHGYYQHSDTYPESLGVELINLLKQGLKEDDIVKVLKLQDTGGGFLDPEDFFLKQQSDLEWIYAIDTGNFDPKNISIQIYRTSNPRTKVDFVFPVWFSYVEFFPKTKRAVEKEMMDIHMMSSMALRCTAAFEKANIDQEKRLKEGMKVTAT